MTDIYRGFSESPRIIDPAPRTTPRSNVSRAVNPASEVPKLRANAKPTIEIVITRTARQTIMDDLFASTRVDGLEAGGFLHGKPTRSWNRQVEILDATHTGDAERTRDSVLLDTGQWIRRERGYKASGLDCRLVGIWHSHPSTRDGTPSTADRKALLSVLEWHEQHGRNAAYSVGLIYAAEDGDSWARPYLHAWVVHRNRRTGTAICEPASIRERR